MLFGIVVAIKGADPIGVYRAMINVERRRAAARIDQVLVRAIPIVLAALAVTVPARAGLVNVGGEGQLIIGAVAATGLGVWLGGSLPGPVTLVVMGLRCGGVRRGCGPGSPGWPATRLGVNEAVTTLLLNFIANDIMLYLIYQPWKDPNGSGPAAEPAARHEGRSCPSCSAASSTSASSSPRVDRRASSGTC